MMDIPQAVTLLKQIALLLMASFVAMRRDSSILISFCELLLLLFWLANLLALDLPQMAHEAEITASYEL